MEQEQERRGRHRLPTRVAALTTVAGIALTALAAWSTARIDQSTEQRLLQVQTRQAATVLSTAIMLIEQPLTNALDVAASTAGDPSTFRRTTDRVVGDGGTFVSASLWRRTGDRLEQVASVGVAPALDPTTASTKDLVASAFGARTFLVRAVSTDDQERIAYAKATSGYAVYAERAIPATKRAPVDRDSAFAELDYATYIGPEPTRAALATTDVNPADLPLTGTTDEARVPFGDTTLLLVTRPREHLGSTLGERLPSLVLVAGLLVTVAAASTAQLLARGRLTAEAGTRTITELYERVDELYARQRDTSERLQRGLLPQVDPAVPGLEIASEYVAGGPGVDIGGDWYDVVVLDDHRFGFVVGDVSGRGVEAAAVMARVRFTLHAYLSEGHGPAEALEKCSGQFDISLDGHMTTALVGVGDAITGHVVMANAGHPQPLLLTTDAVEPVEVPVGRPLGVGPDLYGTSAVEVPVGGTLLAFTDGLVERRSEEIDVGRARLVEAVRGLAAVPVGTLVERVLHAMEHEGAEDDVALLVLRRAVLAPSTPARS